MLYLSVVKGKAKNIRLTVRDRDGALVDLTGKTVRFSAKSSFSSADPATISKSSGAGITHDANQNAGGQGLATMLLSPADTANVGKGSLVVELELIQTAGEPEILDTGFLTVTEAVRTTV